MPLGTSNNDPQKLTISRTKVGLVALGCVAAAIGLRFGLPSDDRKRLLERVILSLDADEARDRAWDEVAVDRDGAIEAGQPVIDGKAVVAELRAALK